MSKTREVKPNEIKKKRKRKNGRNIFSQGFGLKKKIEETRVGVEKKELEKKKRDGQKKEDQEKKRRSRKRKG